MGWIFLIAVILLFAFSFLLEYLFYSTSKKEQQEDGYITRTHSPKRRMMGSFVIMVSLFLASIIIALFFIFSESKLDLAGWIAYAISCLFAIGLPALIFLICMSLGALYLIKYTDILLPKINEATASYISFNNFKTTDILKIVADNIEGGIDSLKERYKKYEKNN